MGKQYKFHPAANAYPLLRGDERTALVDSIRTRGLLNDIVLLDGMILDGRNRYECCGEACVAPRFREYDGDKSPQAVADYVRDQNCNRRHLTSQQRAAAIVLLRKFVADLAETVKVRQRAAGGDRRSAKAKESVTQKFEQAVDRNERTLAAELAKADGGTNRQYVADVLKIIETDESAVEKIRDGELTIQQVKAADKKRNQATQRREQNRRLARPTPESIKALKNSPGILVGPGWWRPDDEDWMDDLLGWRLQERLDPDGGMMIFRTLGATKAIVESVSLLEAWEMEVWPHQLDVATGDAAEILVIGTIGKPDVSRLPTKPKRVLVPATGLESLVRSWFMPWAKQQDTVNAIAEVLGEEPHEGFLPFTWKPEPATC